MHRLLRVFVVGTLAGLVLYLTLNTVFRLGTYALKADDPQHCTICDCCEDHCLKPESTR